MNDVGNFPCDHRSIHVDHDRIVCRPVLIFCGLYLRRAERIRFLPRALKYRDKALVFDDLVRRVGTREFGQRIEVESGKCAGFRHIEAERPKIPVEARLVVLFVLLQNAS